MLVIDKVSKTFLKNKERITVLDKKSHVLQKGQLIAIQGPSGCGKTTLLLIAGGLLHPDNGNVMIDGQDVYELPLEKRADFRGRKIGFVFQQYHLVPYLSVIENILVPSLVSQALKEKALQLAEHFGLGHRLYHKPGELSTGEKQRTALARALLLDPPYLLADEITGNLDHKNAEHVVAYLKEYAAKGGAVLWVTHDRQAAKYADNSFLL